MGKKFNKKVDKWKSVCYNIYVMKNNKGERRSWRAGADCKSVV